MTMWKSRFSKAFENREKFFVESESRRKRFLRLFNVEVAELIVGNLKFCVGNSKRFIS